MLTTRAKRKRAFSFSCSRRRKRLKKIRFDRNRRFSPRLTSFFFVPPENKKTAYIVTPGAPPRSNMEPSRRGSTRLGSTSGGGGGAAAVDKGRSAIGVFFEERNECLSSFSPSSSSSLVPLSFTLSAAHSQKDDETRTCRMQFL